MNFLCFALKMQEFDYIRNIYIFFMTVSYTTDQIFHQFLYYMSDCTIHVYARKKLSKSVSLQRCTELLYVLNILYKSEIIFLTNSCILCSVSSNFHVFPLLLRVSIKICDFISMLFLWK